MTSAILAPFPGRSGGSSEDGKSTAAEWLRQLAPKSAIDVGAGQGIWRNVLAECAPSCKVVAVEVFWPSVVEFGLLDRYDKVIVGDARWLDWRRITATFQPDVVIAGDVVEHMTRPEAIAFLDRLRRMRASVLVSIPVVEWPQGPVDGNPWERHLYQWSDEEFRAVFNPERAVVEGPLGVYLLRPT